MRDLERDSAFPRRAGQLARKCFSEGGEFFVNAFFPNEFFQRRNARRERNGMPAERSRLINSAERRKAIHDFRPPAERAHGKPAADDFSQTNQVRAHLVDAHRSLQGNAESGHHFVKNQQRAATRSQLAKLGEKTGLGHDEADVSEKGLDDNCGDFVPAHRGLSRRNQLVVWVDGYKGLARNLNENTKFSGDDAVVFEIYDTLKDPQETKNLAGKPGFGEDFQQKLRDKALRSRRAFDGKHPHEYTRGLDFSQKVFFEKNPVPAIAKAGNSAQLKFGYKAFASDKAFPWVPDFRQTHLEPVLSGKDEKPLGKNLLPQKFIDGRGARGILIEGTISVPEEGEYVFSLKTDKNKGSKAFVHLYDIQLIDADKLYKPGTEAKSYANVGTENTTGTRGVRLAAGTHKIRIEYVCAANAKNPSVEISFKKK